MKDKTQMITAISDKDWFVGIELERFYIAKIDLVAVEEILDDDFYTYWITIGDNRQRIKSERLDKGGYTSYRPTSTAKHIWDNMQKHPEFTMLDEHDTNDILTKLETMKCHT